MINPVLYELTNFDEFLQFDLQEASVKSESKIGFTLMDVVRLNSRTYEMVNFVKYSKESTLINYMNFYS